MAEHARHQCDVASEGQDRNTDHGGRITVSVIPRLQHVRDLRHLGRAFVNVHAPDTDAADTVELLISEIVTNAVRHTDSHSITLSMSYADDVICLSVSDGTAGRPHKRNPGPDDESGRGLLIVNALAKEWGISRNGSRVWCTVQCTDSLGAQDDADARTAPE
ncbi:ATP-binding protein [Streptomyces longwoodensis]|uniref:ATP-binding protein n=1 Tax=Streptomyces longwoodensis TaxID=68231 RepID=UPI0036FB703D